MKHIRRLIVFGVIVLAIAAGFAIIPTPGSGQLESRIDLTAPVTGANCAPCHASLSDTDVPGLKFSHGVHLLVECVACHISPPHETGRTVRPTMESCFMCHGLEHSAQGSLAASECVDCHTPEHVLRPASHVEQWAAEPHAQAVEAAGSTNDCMMCHDAGPDCDVCHAEQGVDAGPVTPIYLRTIPEQPDLPSVIIDTDAEPTVSSCTHCHATIDDLADESLIFVHDKHLEREFSCASCHSVFPHQMDRTITPDMLSCYRCHGLTHSAWGEVAPEECTDCHPPAFELMPADHTVGFRTGEHKAPAAQEMESCTMCHASVFCEECHMGGVEMANGQPSPMIIPANHRAPEWQPDHGRQFLAQEGACSTCHTSESCTRCHITTMPHPADWLTSHAGNGFAERDCAVCHADRSDCQECHHRDLGSNELVAENCVECHEVMKTDPPTAIKNIGLAEHAVHFNVAERVGRPYVCDDCHIGFTVMRVMQPASQTQAHDLRVCYDCHGALDANKVLIAPWPGSELCRRCHTDLSI